MPSQRLQMKVRNEGECVVIKSRPAVTIETFRELELARRTFDETKEDFERVRQSFALDAGRIASSQRYIAESWALLAKVSRLIEPAPSASCNPAQLDTVEPCDPGRRPSDTGVNQ